jgi:hypothetical protein
VRKVSIGLGAIAAICALAAPASALASQTLTITPKVTGTLGGPGTITFAFNITSSTGGIPSPLAPGQPFIEKNPVGITLSGAGFPTCPTATIQAATGATPPSCPAGSLIGSGSATIQALIGTTMLNEQTVIKAYLTGPSALEFWGNGTTPIAQTVTWPGSTTAGSPPFGQTLVNNVPTVPTVPGGPNASETAFSLTIGATRKVTKTEKVKGKKKKVTTTVGLITLPKKCSGKLTWGASDVYSDGTTNSVTATSACP